MDIFKSSALIAAVGFSLWAVAAAPVAVRVEIETLDVVADGTPVVLTVQISPEDRPRIGKNAMVRVTLDGETPPGQSPLWAVRIEDDGSGRIETVWPPGEHALRVEISNPSGEDTGLWVGTVRIPGVETDLSDDDGEPPASERVPTPGAAGGDAAVGSAIAEAPAAPPALDEPAEVAATEASAPEQPSATSGGTPVPGETAEAPPEPDAAVQERMEDGLEEAATVPEQVSADAEAAAEKSEPTAEDSVAAAAVVGAAAAPQPRASVEPPAAPAPSEAEPSPMAQDAGRGEPDKAVVEPLRGDAPETRVEGGPAVVPPPEMSTAPPEPPPAEVAAALEAWADADPATADLTVIALRDGEPTTGLTPSDFSLRVGGKDAMIEDVGGRDRAPLQLGIAVNVSAGGGAGWSQSGGRLFPLVQRARGARGHLFFATDELIGDWDGGPGVPREGGAARSAGDVTSLIVDSLERFAGRRGRAFLVVVTDGRIDADKAAWNRATDEAENSGVPVLVIALWDQNFNHRIRRNLKTIANVSGGGLFLVQGSDQLDRAAERFGPMIDAGVALRFVWPPAVTPPASVSVETGDKDLEVIAPKGVR